MVTARAGLLVQVTEAEQAAAGTGRTWHVRSRTAPTPPSRCSSLWAALPARIYEIFPLLCSNCGTEMRVISFITRRDPIERILAHISEPTQPPVIAPARSPPLSGNELDQTPAYALDTAEPVPEFEFDQSVPF